MRELKVLAVLVFLLQLAAPATIANAAEGAAKKTGKLVNGTATDALGRPMEGVRVILQTNDGRILGHSVTDKGGHFFFSNVAPGMYAVVANKADFKTALALVTVTAAGAKPVELAMEAQTALSLQLRAQKLNQARNDLSPETGSSFYRFTQQSIQEMPAGNNTPMSQVLLQAPGVVQDSFGGLHIRGEHAELQYRINGIELPEGVTSGFSQTLSPRFAQSISLLEGALPAQYGYHTAGVVQIQTKSGKSLSGGNIDMYGGQRDTLQPSFELGGSKGDLSYYTTGYYLQNNRGLEPPTPGPEAIHDFATIGNDFGYLSYFLNPTTRISLLGGFNLSNFEIPANPDQSPAFHLAGVPYYPSKNIKETQLEQNYFGVLALQGLID